MEWLTRMADVIELMELNLADDIDINEVAARAYASPFHFQRMFHMLTGFTVAEYIRKRRLTLAAQELAVASAKVLDVSLKYRYDSPESFAKAFRKVHGISPSEARRPGVKLKAFPRISFHLSLKGDQNMDYKIVNRDAFNIVGKFIQVSCKDGENTRRIPQLWNECNSDGTVTLLSTLSPGTDVLGVCLEMDHATEMLTYGVAIEANAEPPTGMKIAQIPAATWAVFTSVGPMPHAIQDVWQRIFEEWFPSTGYQHSGGPELEVYPLGDVSADDYRCEVWIPVINK